MPTVSTYCSRNWLFTIASRKLRDPRFCVYQLGRGSEPVMVVGSMRSLVPRSIVDPPKIFEPLAARHHWSHIRTIAMRMGTHDRHAVRTNRAHARCPSGVGSAESLL